MLRRSEVRRSALAAGLLALILTLGACGDTAPGTPDATQPAAPSATATLLQALATAPAQQDETPDTSGGGPIIEVPPEPTPEPTPAGLDEEQLATIYGQVVRDLLRVSEEAKGEFPRFIGINPKAGQGELLDTSASSVDIPDVLIPQLLDLGATVAFIPFTEAVEDLEDGGQVRDNGVYLTLGTLREDPLGDGYQLYASYYHAIDDAAGYTYVLGREDNAWKIRDRKEIWRQ